MNLRCLGPQTTHPQGDPAKSWQTPWHRCLALPCPCKLEAVHIPAALRKCLEHQTGSSPSIQVTTCPKIISRSSTCRKALELTGSKVVLPYELRSFHAKNDGLHLTDGTRKHRGAGSELGYAAAALGAAEILGPVPGIRIIDVLFSATSCRHLLKLLDLGPVVCNSHALQRGRPYPTGPDSYRRANGIQAC